MSFPETLWHWILVLATFVGIPLVLALALTGCGPACKLQQQRCHGGVAQLCGTDKQWRDVLDCSKMQSHKKCGCEGDPARCRCRRGH